MMNISHDIFLIRSELALFNDLKSIQKVGLPITNAKMFPYFFKFVINGGC